MLHFLGLGLVTPAGLSNLSKHKYKSAGFSVLDKILDPTLWNWAVSKCPMWLAPNLITLVGTLLMISTLVVAEMAAHPCGHEGYPTLPWWAHAYIMTMHFLYQTLDAIDGKQARRTGAASPLGQLFDHGCDALCATILMRTLTLCIGLGGVEAAHASWHGPATLVAGITVFYLAQWEEKYTHTLQTQLFGFGVTEIQWLIILLHGVSAALPCTFFASPLGDVSALEAYAEGFPSATPKLPIASAALARTLITVFSTPVNHAIAWVAVVGCSGAVLRFLWTTLAVSRGRAVTDLFTPIAIITTAAFVLTPTVPYWQFSESAWVAARKAAAPALEAASAPGPLVLLGAIALGLTLHTTRTIVASVAQQSLPLLDLPALCVPIAVAALLSAGPRIPVASAPTLLWAAVAAQGVTYLCYVGGAVKQIAAYLGIRPFTVPGHGTARKTS